MSILSPTKDPGIFSTKQLTNGIPLFYRQSEQAFGLPNVACSVLVTVGGRDDPKGKEGAAHFFEHMPFRGTKNFPTQKELTHPIEQNGGYINAFTTDEATGYEIIVPSDMLDMSVERLADMLLHPLLREEDIEVERHVILEELRNKLASVNFYARQELYQRLLGDHPLVNAVIGSESAVNSITQGDLRAFHGRFYNASNIALFFAGQFDEDQLITLAEKYFGSVKSGEPTTRDMFVSLEAESRQDKKVVLTPSNYNRSVLMVGRILPPASLKESLMNKLFRDMLSAGMNSPLYVEIRDKRGLAYGLGLHHNRYQDVSLFLFSVSTQFRHMAEVQKIFWRETQAILTNQARFDEVKHMFRQGVLHREYNAGLLVDSAIDSYLDYKRIMPLEEFIHALESITLTELSAHLHDYLTPKSFTAIEVNCDNIDEGTVNS